MKKFITLSIIFVFCLTLLAGCGSDASDVSDVPNTPAVPDEEVSLERFVGEWTCRDATFEQYGEDDATYVGYLYLTVHEDGSFTLNNIEENYQAMGGMMYLSGTGALRVECEGEFIPPECWEGIEMKADLTYLFDFVDGKDLIRLTYTNADGVSATLLLDRVISR